MRLARVPFTIITINSFLKGLAGALGSRPAARLANDIYDRIDK